MPVIQDLGDEATYFLISIFVIVIAVLAWWSTRLREDPIRTVLIFERRDSIIIRRAVVQHPVTISIMRSANIIHPEQSSSSMESASIVESSPVENTQEQEAPVNHTVPKMEDSSPDSEIEQVIQRMDTDSEPALASNVPSSTMNLENMPASGDGLRRRKPGNDNKFDSIPTTSRNNEPAIRCPCILKDSNGLKSDCCCVQGDDELLPSAQGIVDYCASSAMNIGRRDPEEDVSESEKQTSAKDNGDASNITTAGESSRDPNVITIKLKYINDDIKVVDGKLEEILGDFKRRHFGEELDARKIVRLIFNGQVLVRDRESLSRLGLYDNCVVHCLVQSPRTNVFDAPSGNVDAHADDVVFVEEESTNGNQNCDVTLFLYVMLGLIIVVAWWMRFSYAHLFSWQSTASLLGLSGVVVAAILGTYFPDRSLAQATTTNN